MLRQLCGARRLGLCPRILEQICRREQDAVATWLEADTKPRTSMFHVPEIAAGPGGFMLVAPFAAAKAKGKGKSSAGSQDAVAVDAPDLTRYQGLMEKAEERLQTQLGTVRTGRASTGLLESLRVDIYGDKSPLKSIASITVRGAQLLGVTPFDPETLPAVEKAIRESALKLSPEVRDGELVVPVPKMLDDTRKAMVKMIKVEAEVARVSVRNSRKEAMAAVKRHPSEDERKRLEKQVQKFTDQFIERIDKLTESKERELSHG